ncbi:hypothetical protein [Halarcobacter anaerophilus]|uniref:hypothetical protein n=1 Tax=Halarcobacter anaerophilus TaxID=877500 RepID=UPI0005C93A20|nr:hypothetical protein [Halarcobacter anaerophilus]
METRINKFPYFLWLNKDVEIDINEDRSNTVYENKESELKKVSKYEILALKHLPILVIFVLTFNLPGIQDFLIGSLVFSLLAFIVIKYLEHLQKVLFAFMLLGWYLVWNGYALHIEQVLSVVAQLSLIGFMVYDLYNLEKRDQYYYLKNLTTTLEVSGTRKYPWIIDKIFKTQTKRISWLNLIMPGFYIKLPKDL